MLIIVIELGLIAGLLMAQVGFEIETRVKAWRAANAAEIKAKRQARWIKEYRAWQARVEKALSAKYGALCEYTIEHRAFVCGPYKMTVDAARNAYPAGYPTWKV